MIRVGKNSLTDKINKSDVAQDPRGNKHNPEQHSVSQQHRKCLTRVSNGEDPTTAPEGRPDVRTCEEKGGNRHERKRLLGLGIRPRVSIRNMHSPAELHESSCHSLQRQRIHVLPETNHGEETMRVRTQEPRFAAPSRALLPQPSFENLWRCGAARC